jgi:hypothetical protein
MAKFRRTLGLLQFDREKTEVVEATLWEKMGDHLAVVPAAACRQKPQSEKPFSTTCRDCYRDVIDHGLLITYERPPLLKWLTTPIYKKLKHERKKMVCPGDYIVRAPGHPNQRQVAEKFTERYEEIK